MPAQTLSALTKTILPDDRQAYLAYYNSTLPNPKDDELARVCEAYKAESPEQRLQTALAIGDAQVNWLSTYAYRMSMLSVRQESPAILQNALVALLFAAKKNDERDMVTSLSLLHRAAQWLQVGERAFREAAPYAPDADAQELLLGFLQRADEDKQVESLGYRELQGQSGLIFVFGDLPVPPGLL